MDEKEIIKRLKNIIEINKSFLDCDIQENSNIYKDIQGLLDLYNKEKEKNRKAIEYIKTHKYREGYSHRDLNNNGKLVFEMIETTLVSGTDLLKILEENK